MAIEDEGDILIVVRPRPHGGAYTQDLRPERAPLEAFERRAAEIAGSITRIAQTFRGHFDKAEPETPQGRSLREVEMKFGLEVQAETSVVISKASATCTFEVTLRWSAAKPS